MYTLECYQRSSDKGVLCYPNKYNGGLRVTKTMNSDIVYSDLEFGHKSGHVLGAI